MIGDFEKDLLNALNDFFQKWGWPEISAYELLLDIGILEKKIKISGSNDEAAVFVLSQKREKNES
jgi:hypothetical protein